MCPRPSRLINFSFPRNLHINQIEDLKGQVNSGTQREEKVRSEMTDMKHRLMATQSKLFQAEDKSKSEEDMVGVACQMSHMIFLKSQLGVFSHGPKCTVKFKFKLCYLENLKLLFN